jgi:hypothetical protein
MEDFILSSSPKSALRNIPGRKLCWEVTVSIYGKVLSTKVFQLDATFTVGCD